VSGSNCLPCMVSRMNDLRDCKVALERLCPAGKWDDKFFYLDDLHRLEIVDSDSAVVFRHYFYNPGHHWLHDGWELLNTVTVEKGLPFWSVFVQALRVFTVVKFSVDDLIVIGRLAVDLPDNTLLTQRGVKEDPKPTRRVMGKVQGSGLREVKRKPKKGVFDADDGDLLDLVR